MKNCSGTVWCPVHEGLTPSGLLILLASNYLCFLVTFCIGGLLVARLAYGAWEVSSGLVILNEGPTIER